LIADGPSSLVLEGGTHNPFAPPFDFLDKTFLPLVKRMGARVEATLERPGFYPAGGGKFSVKVEPARALKRLDLASRGETLRRSAKAVVANLPRSIAQRELSVIRARTSWPDEWLTIQVIEGSRGPGNVVMIEVECERVTEVFTAFGERGVRAETVAERAVRPALEYLGSQAAVCEHLADQLIVPMAIVGGGSFTTGPLSRHATTNIEVVRRFLDVEISVSPVDKRVVRVQVSGLRAE
jgi:RNA 3'-terminal phosphate cyclase (ATP)